MKAMVFLLPLFFSINTTYGVWNLAMNVDPNDGHLSGWASPQDCSGTMPVNCAMNAGIDTYWDGDFGYNTAANALTQDFKDVAVYKQTARHITVARHEDGVCKMYQSWTFQAFTSKQGSVAADATLLDRFLTAYRTTVSAGNEYAGSGSDPLDPIFSSSNHALIFNWYYSNNGARLIVSDQATSPEGTNDDESHGLGMESQSKQGYTSQSGSSGNYVYDAGNSKAGRASTQANYGNDASQSRRSYLTVANHAYAIYVSDAAQPPAFTCDGVTPLAQEVGDLPCPAGEFSASGKQPCTAKKTAGDCAAGEEFTAGDDNHLTSDDAACNGCAAGSFKLAAGAGSCATHKVAADCPAGTKFDATNASATADANCEACVGGFSAAGATDCTAHNACTEKGVKTAGTATEQAVCNGCNDLTKKSDCKGAVNSDSVQLCDWDKMQKRCLEGEKIKDEIDIEQPNLLDRLILLETKVANDVLALTTKIETADNALSVTDAGLQTQIDSNAVNAVNSNTVVTKNTQDIAAIVADYVTSKEVTDSVKGKSYLAYCETAKRKNQNAATRRGCGCACDFLTGGMDCPAGVCTVDPSKKKYARLKMTPKETSVCFLTSTRADNPHSSHDAECIIEAMTDGWYLQASSYDNEDYTACEARCMEFL